MKVTIKKLPKSEIELTVEVANESLDPYLKRAAEKISKNYKFEGFRPGKAPVNIVEQKVGKMVLWEEAMELAIPKFYVDAVLQEKLEVVGQPEITPQKVAPANSFIFKAKVGVLPEIKLPKLEELKIKGNKVEVSDKEVSEAVEEIRNKRATSVRVKREAKKGDRVEVDFTVKVDKVVIEGGQSKNHPLVIGENKFIPGFEDNLIGMKEDESKNFALTFPKDYGKKDLANKEADFEVKVKSVQEMKLPEIDDKFVKELGDFKDEKDLKEKLKANILREKEEKEKQRFEASIVSKIQEIIEKEKELEIPEVLVASEQHKMIHEFEDTLSQQGANLEQYLQSIKKSAEDFEKEQRPMALKRVKFGLIVRKAIEDHKIKVDAKEVEQEIAKIKGMYEKIYKAQKANQNVNEILKQFDTDEYKNYIESMILNRKVFEFLASKVKKI